MNISIFVVDDEESDRDAIQYALEETGEFQITGFYDPVSFLMNLSNDVNIVITDIRIPGYDVFEAIKYIHDNFPGIYIIVVSGFFGDDVYQKLFELNVDRVVLKDGTLAWATKTAKYVNEFVPKIQLKQDLLQ